ncbi:NUDIX hydrolase [Nocardioides albus]|uniref:8-oxo-dGTP pyrophosphatase MutT (NUDIX family) n=1 Tax=Nocardioides albus TaxID=1841 RepID=A0A7W5AA53_9ACTN|nr:NUDIX domain-containing protein [Nocardioides albus]MBB3092179.1 8-oxo-dGTP pyrophosphatase MutT (NUDIX family) [Nocardioides albus]GGU46064.1 putative MutT/NUDIX-like protein [Nocardioides albus]
MNTRIEHWRNPDAPKPNSLVPASNILVVNDAGEILLQRRRDTGQWALPGGKQEFGETPSACAIREGEEETGVRAEITGLLGVYSDPAHLIEYLSDGEVRQEYEVTFIGRPVAGEPTVNDEASDVRWVAEAALDQYDIHPTMRRQIDDYLNQRYPVAD